MIFFLELRNRQPFLNALGLLAYTCTDAVLLVKAKSQLQGDRVNGSLPIEQFDWLVKMPPPPPGFCEWNISQDTSLTKIKYSKSKKGVKFKII